MPTTPAIKASTQTKVTDSPLMRAMAAAISAGAEGRSNLDKISTKLRAKDKEQHAKQMAKGKRK